MGVNRLALIFSIQTIICLVRLGKTSRVFDCRIQNIQQYFLKEELWTILVVSEISVSDFG